MDSRVLKMRDETAKFLGNDVDVSYITEELLKDMDAAKAYQPDPSNAPPDGSTPGARWQMNGNSVTFDGTKTHWRNDCSSTEWWQIAGRPHQERIVNCNNGFIRYKLWG